MICFQEMSLTKLDIYPYEIILDEDPEESGEFAVHRD
jgi:hypothetical protein